MQRKIGLRNIIEQITTLFLSQSHSITVILQKSENFHSIDRQKHLSSQDKPGKWQRRIKVLDRERCIGMQNCMLSWSAICKFFHFSINVHLSSHRWDANQSSHQNNPSPVPELHCSHLELPLTHKPHMPVPPLHPSWKEGHDLCIIRYIIGGRGKRDRIVQFDNP